MNNAKLLSLAKFRLKKAGAIAAGDFKVYAIGKGWRTLPIPEGYTARKSSEVLTATGKKLATARPAVRWIVEKNA